MADEDKPFVCTEMGCGMRFTNEDHLSVHLKKHDMNLALNLSSALGGISPMAVFTDQTPTPTKFLKNCEEIGLFQDLTKNPFDDSFKKAMDDPLDMETSADEQVYKSIPIPGPNLNDLDTPQPTIPKVVINDEEEPTHNKVATTVVKTGSESKRTDTSITSIVPKKRKKFLTQSMATSTTSEDEDESVIDSSSAGIEAASPPKMAAKGKNSPPAVSSSTEELKQKAVIVSESAEPAAPASVSEAPPVMVQVYVQLPNGLTLPVEVPATTLTPSQQRAITPQQIIQLPHVINNPVAAVPQPVVISSPPTVTQPPAQLISLPKNVPQVVLPTTNLVQTVPTTVLGQAPVDPVYMAPHLRQVKLGTSPLAQGAVGTVIQQKSFGNATVTVKTKTAPERPSVTVPTSPVTIKSPSASISSAGSAANTTHGGSLLYTKQRLKAALQQQTTPSSSQKISQMLQLVNTEVKREPNLSPGPTLGPGPDSSTFVSSSGNISSPEELIMAATPLSSYSIDDGEDSDGRRRKFLERNRAAAARCRQKRKKWVTNLESKAEEMTSVNIKLSTEIKALRGEIAQLKTLLLAHKECPVTLQQKSQGQITPQTYAIEPTQDDCVAIENMELPKTVATVSINSDALPNILATVNQSVSPTPVNASMVPNIISLNQSTLQTTTAPQLVNSAGLVPSILTLDQSEMQTVTHAGMTHATMGGDLLPSIITIEPSVNNVAGVKCDAQSLGVITGPNSISMIPKIINMDQLLQNKLDAHKS